jgi:hypothetical protein
LVVDVVAVTTALMLGMVALVAVKVLVLGTV